MCTINTIDPLDTHTSSSSHNGLSNWPELEKSLARLAKAHINSLKPVTAKQLLTWSADLYSQIYYSSDSNYNNHQDHVVNCDNSGSNSTSNTNFSGSQFHHTQLKPSLPITRQKMSYTTTNTSNSTPLHISSKTNFDLPLLDDFLDNVDDTFSCDNSSSNNNNNNNNNNNIGADLTSNPPVFVSEKRLLLRRSVCVGEEYFERLSELDDDLEQSADFGTWFSNEGNNNNNNSNSNINSSNNNSNQSNSHYNIQHESFGTLATMNSFPTHHQLQRNSTALDEDCESSGVVSRIASDDEIYSNDFSNISSMTSNTQQSSSLDDDDNYDGEVLAVQFDKQCGNKAAATALVARTGTSLTNLGNNNNNGNNNNLASLDTKDSTNNKACSCYSNYMTNNKSNDNNSIKMNLNYNPNGIVSKVPEFTIEMINQFAVKNNVKLSAAEEEEAQL